MTVVFVHGVPETADVWQPRIGSLVSQQVVTLPGDVADRIEQGAGA